MDLTYGFQMLRKKFYCYATSFRSLFVVKERTGGEGLTAEHGKKEKVPMTLCACGSPD